MSSTVVGESSSADAAPPIPELGTPTAVAGHLIHAARFYAGEVSNQYYLTHWSKEISIPNVGAGVQSPKVMFMLLRQVITERVPPDRILMELIKALILAAPVSTGPKPSDGSQTERASGTQNNRPGRISQVTAMILDTCLTATLPTPGAQKAGMAAAAESRSRHPVSAEGVRPLKNLRNTHRSAVIKPDSSTTHSSGLTPQPPPNRKKSASDSKADGNARKGSGRKGPPVKQIGMNGIDPRRGSVKVPMAKLDSDEKIAAGATGVEALKPVPKMLLHFLLDHLIEYMSQPKIAKRKQEMVPHHVVANMMAMLMELWKRLTPAVLASDRDAEMVLIKIRDLVKSLNYQQKLLDKVHIVETNEPISLITDGENKIQQTWETLLYICRMMAMRLLQLSPPLVATHIYSDARRQIQAQRTNLEARHCHWGKLASNKSWSLPMYMAPLEATTSRLFMELSPRCTISARDVVINNFPHTPMVDRFNLVERFMQDSNGPQYKTPVPIASFSTPRTSAVAESRPRHSTVFSGIASHAGAAAFPDALDTPAA